MCDDVGKAVQVHHLNCKHYRHEGIYARVNQIVDPSSPLHDTDEAYIRALPELFCNWKYDYARDMTKAYFSPAVNTGGALYRSAVHNIQDKKLLKHRYCMVIRSKQH